MRGRPSSDRRVAAPILASGATVVLGLLCLLLSDLDSNPSLGPVGVIGIVCAVLAMTVFLPALLDTLIVRSLLVPAILNELDDRVLVVRLGDGRTHAAAVAANVTFEVDQIDTSARSGWSVLVRGLAEELTDDHRDDLVARTRAAGATPWAPGERGHWMRIIPHSVTGRRIVPGDLPPAFLDAGYL